MEAWFAEGDVLDVPNPNAMYLATVDADGTPSVRTVLRRGFDERGVVFYTNYESRKSLAMIASGRASVLFHWDQTDRQIRIEGRVSQVEAKVSDAYFAARHPESQLGAWASRQSKSLSNRSQFEEEVEAMRSKFSGSPVPRPSFWGGYRVSLDAVEIWQGHPHRLHDRVRWTASDEGGFTSTRLYP
jgi:pyridoxamine 5'-phosphate oxidase